MLQGVNNSISPSKKHIIVLFLPLCLFGIMPYAKPNMCIKAIKVSFGLGVANDIRLKEVICSAVERHNIIAQWATWLLKLYCLNC